MSVERIQHEQIKESIEKLNDIQQLEIYKIVRKYTDHITRTDSGVFVSMDTLSSECIHIICNYISFCNTQKRQEDDFESEKKRLERMMKPLV